MDICLPSVFVLRRCVSVLLAYSIIPFINQDLRLDLFSNWFYANILFERLLLLSGLSNEVDKLQLYNVDKLLS